MDIRIDLEARAELIRRIQEREFSERTGIHMSDLNYCLNKQMLRRMYPVEDPAKVEQDLLLFSIGWSTQRWITGKDEDEEPITVDGITVTLDSLLYGKPWELKATYQSSNKPIEENTHWIRQIMAQAHVKGQTQVYLSRFELLGDWGSVYPRGKTKQEKDECRKASKRPTLNVYRITFSAEELAQNWEWFKGRREQFAVLLETQECLPRIVALAPNGAFECAYCYYNGRNCFEKEG